MSHPTDRPRTPVMKRLFRDVLKPTLALGKRTRDAENVPPTPQKPKPHCVALQNDDEDEDAVVITTLHTIPFCCHADLLAMGRAELAAAAHALNAALPAALRIDAGAARSDAFVRHSIELLVGINTAGGRKRDRSLSLYDVSADAATPHVLPASPLSPLRTRPRANTPHLAPLREERTDDDAGAARPQKRRRVGPPPASPTPQPRRAPSQRLPVRPPGLPRNVTLTRGGRRPRAQSTVLTSTPRAAPEESFCSAATGLSELDGRSAWVAESLDGGVEREDVRAVVKGLEGMSLAVSRSTLSDMQISDDE